MILRSAIGVGLLTTLFLSQRFWYRTIWRITGKWRTVWARVSVRLAYVVALILVIVAVADAFRMGHHGHIIPRSSIIGILTGLWITSALFAFLAIKLVRAIDRGWSWLRKKSRAQSGVRSAVPNGSISHSSYPAERELLPDPSRRHFFRSASVLAGAVPFATAVYGFAAERLNYQIYRVEIPLANLPPALEGLKIVQLSDIHLSGYMPRTQVRHVVAMANELGAHLAAITGDLITGAGDSMADCVEELRQLRVPLGVWGCNGNHEIYAKAEDAAQELFRQAGMKLLRHENAQLTFRNAQFNLIGVDYQRERSKTGNKVQMLPYLDPLVRRDMPNILLSHNPNSFNRAAELGVELSLSGHTHGGQVQVEILDHRLSPARFITDYVAGSYYRPLYMPAPTAKAMRDVNNSATNEIPSSSHAQPALSVLYVNRGIGTVGAPVRLGVPPEITLLTLRRA
jgi:predicted MPP superfamily phosphohydrolase